LIIGLEKSAIGTLVERTSRFTMLLHLPRMEGFGANAYVKNGPAVAGHGAEAVRDAITAQIGTLPQQLRRSLTWDQGGEMAQHVQLKIDAGIAVYFCDPRSPWQRPSNENTNGLLRPVLPQGHRLIAMECRGGRRCRCSAQRAAPQGARLAWESRAEAERAVETAEAAAAAAVDRLVAERLSIADVVKLTGLDQTTVRRLRQAKALEETATFRSPLPRRTDARSKAFNSLRHATLALQVARFRRVGCGWKRR
jgi:hypothetical protein